MVDLAFETKPGIVDEPKEESKITPELIIKESEDLNLDVNGKILWRDKKVVREGIQQARTTIAKEAKKSENKATEGAGKAIGKMTMIRRAAPALLGAVVSFARGALRWGKAYIPEATGAKTKLVPSPPPNVPQAK